MLKEMFNRFSHWTKRLFFVSSAGRLVQTNGQTGTADHDGLLSSSDRKVIVRDLVFLFVAALLLRSVYFYLAVSHIGLDGLWTTIFDSAAYRSIANEIVSGDEGGRRYLFEFGPGYGLILAALQILFGSSGVWGCLFNIVMGSLGPLAVYLMAWFLIGSRPAALLSGLICAVSSTSVALSCNILSDQPFFTFHAAALLCFIVGLKSGRKRLFVVAGLLAGMAAFIRPLGQFWPVLFFLIPIIIPLPDWCGNRRTLLGRAWLTAGVMALLLFSWSARNYFVEDSFVFGGKGMETARSYLAARTVAENSPGVSLAEVRDEWNREDKASFEGRPSTLAEYHQLNKDHVIATLTTQPGRFVATYFDIVWENMLAGNHIPLKQVPQLAGLWHRLVALSGKWINQTLFYVTVLGLLVLVRRRRRTAAIILTLTYTYFTFIAGFSFFQGSRLHYPAEMAWSILVAVAVHSTIVAGAGLVGRAVRTIRT